MRDVILMAAMLAAAGGAGAQQVRGADIYKSSCAMCHQDQGQGAAGVAPPLKGSQWAKLARVRNYAPGVLLAGMHGPLSTDEGTFNGVMPTQNRLNDEEIAAVTAYLVSDIAGQNGAPVVVAADVAALRARPQSVAELRAVRKQALAK
ncbi:c-type cytochrome [Duganella sp. FT92W]|uniref:C-type cytochrome n=1 Tax=Pseudoduganella rivuli TaxID=2666085 RepID=A0A7X2LQW2_9BURK|nr:cytochrome c [Pseudoduganella rivuli]MRV71790.1 c-type cytochrome [Pseudoduganella rivuli]